jgi:hypothetical protein
MRKCGLFYWLATISQSAHCCITSFTSVYVPIGNANHRVWRVVPEESIPLGTKERVPCIITLEVVAYKPKRSKPVGWSFLPKRTHQTQTGVSLDTAGSSSPTQSRRPLAEAVEMDSTESELLADWRYGRRDPFRRTPFLDKVTGSMKEATDKMSAQMRDRINNFRERSASDELQSLKLADAVMNGADSFAPRDNERDRDPEANVSTGSLHDATVLRTGIVAVSPSISRHNSAASLASMGQWSSPIPLAANSAEKVTNERQGVSQQSSSVLPYGSNHENERTNNASTNDTKTSSVPRPLVVFRESWQAKESRIRQKSAYGSHPGWR